MTSVDLYFNINSPSIIKSLRELAQNNFVLLNQKLANLYSEKLQPFVSVSFVKEILLISVVSIV